MSSVSSATGYPGSIFDAIPTETPSHARKACGPEAFPTQSATYHSDALSPFADVGSSVDELNMD